MIGYTSVGTNDLDKAVHFYSELLALLGAKPFFKTDRGIGRNRRRCTRFA